MRTLGAGGGGWRGGKWSDRDPSAVSASQVNAQRRETGERNSTHEREVLQATLLLNRHIHTQLYRGLTKPLSKADSDDLFFVCPSWSSRSECYLRTATRENSESWQPICFTVGFRKGNAWRSPPLSHWASHFPSPLPQFPIWKWE